MHSVQADKLMSRCGSYERSTRHSTGYHGKTLVRCITAANVRVSTVKISTRRCNAAATGS